MFHIGWASVDITPSGPVWLGGYAARYKPSEGIHDPIYVKVCFLFNGITEVALVACDLIALSLPQVEAIRSKIMKVCGVERVIVGATHTHSAPISCLQLQWGNAVMDMHWLSNIADSAAQAVEWAKQSATPAKLYAVITRQCDVAKNRRPGEVIADHELSVLRAVHEDGQTGFIVNYACHGTVLDASNYLISADFPGYLYSGIQERFSTEHTLFFNGACADVNLGYSADASAMGVNMGELRSFKNAEHQAQLLINAIEDAMGTSVELEPDLTFIDVPLLLPVNEDLPKLVEVADELDKLRQSDKNDTDTEMRKIYLMALLRNIEVYCPCGERVIKAESHLLGIGKVLIVTVPGELFCEIGMYIKDLFRENWMPVIFGYSDGYFGYIPSNRAFQLGGYECETSIYSHNIEQYLKYLYTDLASKLTRKG